MSDNQSKTEKRKQSHLDLFKNGGIDFKRKTTLLECVHPIHCALPEINSENIDTSSSFAGHSFGFPLIITGMTGGTSEAQKINKTLAKIANDEGIGFGVGSQRAIFKNSDITSTYEVRDVAPDVFLAGNIGAVQLSKIHFDEIDSLVNAIKADALCVHLNPAQELIQPEGDTDFSGLYSSLEAFMKHAQYPVIIKETGAGISKEVALSLEDAGVKYVDVAGAGGTSWTGVELMRSEDDDDMSIFWDWGIPTAACLLDLQSTRLEVMASGGIRNGLDMVKSIMLGANICGMASPFIQTYYESSEPGCKKLVKKLKKEFRLAMLLCGCENIEALKKAPKVITGELLKWER